MTRSPIPLNDAQEQAVKEWAADDRLWTTQETVEFNLRTFVRKILAESRLTAERDEWRERYDAMTADYHTLVERKDAWITRCQHLEQVLEETGMDDGSGKRALDYLRDLAEMKDNYLGACKLVAQMHAAAVGELTGPRRGVVEDVADLRAKWIAAREGLRYFAVVLDDRGKNASWTCGICGQWTSANGDGGDKLLIVHESTCPLAEG